VSINSNKKAGRAYQSTIAKRMGGKSVGTIEGQDIEHPLFSIECKKRKAFVATNWMEQCISNAPEGKTPLLLVHVTGQRHKDDLAIMRLADFEDWLGKVKT
jgi:hypothetical protein